MKPYFSPEKGCFKSNDTFTATGLQILLVQISSEPDSNYSYNNNKTILLLKTATLKSAKPPTTTAHENCCFLKSCFLCRKSLQPDKDVYMYRGDQGFCSIECRERQIFIDEMKETEISLNLTLQSIRHRRRCQTSTRFNDFRHDADRRPILFSYS